MVGEKLARYIYIYIARMRTLIFIILPLLPFKLRGLNEYSYGYNLSKRDQS